MSTSQDETNRILAMGLTHEENLAEAQKLDTAHMISVVSLQLTNAREEKIQAEIDFVESEKYAALVKVSENKSSFIGPELVQIVKRGILETDIDTHTLYLKGVKNDSKKEFYNTLKPSMMNIKFNNSRVLAGTLYEFIVLFSKIIDNDFVDFIYENMLSNIIQKKNESFFYGGALMKMKHQYTMGQCIIQMET